MNFSLRFWEVRRLHRPVAKLLSYAVTGGIAAIADLGCFVALLHVGTVPVVAGTLSFLLAAIVNYLLTAKHVFARSVSPRGFLAFLGGALGGMAVNVSITTLSIAFARVDPSVAKMVGIGIAFFANYWINSHIVFALPDLRSRKRKMIFTIMPGKHRS